MKKIAIIGASGHGKVVADIAKLNGYEDIIFLDDNKDLKRCGTYEVAGMSEDAAKFSKDGYDLIVAIGNAKIREKIIKTAGKTANVATLIHPCAVIADSARIGKGTVVMAGAVINPDAVIGEGCIINTSSSVDHDCVLGDYVHVSVGAHVAGTVSVGSATWVGAGATVSNNISICGGCMIGAGAVVVKNIDVAGTYTGVPAKLSSKTI